MDARDWTVAVIEPNKYEAQIELDFLRAAGVSKFRWFKNAAEASDALQFMRAQVVVAELDAFGADGLDWVKRFRRDPNLADRKASIFILARNADRALAERCRHAGVNALISKPVSASGLIATIKKVLATPREWVDAAGYVGPCRRSGIVTRGVSGAKRRNSDRAALDVAALTAAVASLARATGAAVHGREFDQTAALGATKNIESLARDVCDPVLADAAREVGAALGAGELSDSVKARLANHMDSIAQGVARALTDIHARAEMAARVKAAERAKTQAA